MKTFKGKSGKIVGILARKNIQKLADKNPRILKIVPSFISKTIKKAK